MANIRVRMDHEAVQELRELRMQRRGVNKAGVELGEKPKIYTVYLSEKFDGIELGPKDGGISLGRMQPLCAATAAFPNAKSDESRDASYSPPSTGPDINRAFPSRRFRLKRSASPSLLTCAQSTATLTTTVMISMPTNRGSNQKACTIGANMRGDMPGGQVPDVAFGCRESEWRYGNSNG
ncbi:hypothetical protein FRB96_004634 [Tulasnella sp. 330]|nr:hypothetical protein FRB96_004634 [Tulasnella sp. 330]